MWNNSASRAMGSRGGPDRRVDPNGFAECVESVVEQKSYPHRARNRIGAVPEPRYSIQDRFLPENPSFPGYGLDAAASRRVGSAPASAPYSTTTADTSASPPSRGGVRPKGVDLNALGIDKNRHTFGLPSQSGQAHVPVSARGVPWACAAPNPEKSHVSQIVEVALPKGEAVQTHTKRVSLVPEQQILNSTEAPAASPRRHQVDSVKEMFKGFEAVNAAAAAQSASRADSRLKQCQAAADIHSANRSTGIGSSRMQESVIPAGRPTTASLGGNTITRGFVPPDPMQATKTRSELCDTLRRCGLLFDSVTRNREAFETVWKEAGGGTQPSDRVTVSAFRAAMERLKL